MTEDKIERIYENLMDLIDQDLMEGIITQEEYDQKVEYLRLWQGKIIWSVMSGESK